MLNQRLKFRQGATSIYVVVIATLLFSVITVSFIRIIINETSKTTSDELAQSAYDSALAGVEDTKTALKRYYECADAGDAAIGDANCELVMRHIDGALAATSYDSRCDAVSRALGRIGETETKEVLVKEEYDSTARDANVVQAYTCIIIDNTPTDYRSTLGSGDTIRVIPLKAADVNSVTGVRIKWYTDEDGSADNYNYKNASNFTSLTEGTPIPPTLSAQIIQTAPSFTLSQFDNSDTANNRTNRGTVFLTPTNNNADTPHVPQSILINSNNHSYDRDLAVAPANQPSRIYCPDKNNSDARIDSAFGCVASIEIPAPIDGGNIGSISRNADTFFLVLSLPYGQPTTTFAVQLCIDEYQSGSPRGDCRYADGTEAVADFVDVQISVDSTGRANDMYSRVEARLEFRDIYFPFPEFALQATSNNEDAIKKNFYVTDNCIKVSGSGTVEPCSNTGTE